MKYVEDRFNKKFNYPWVFLNEVPFDKTFVEYVVFQTQTYVLGLLMLCGV